MQRVICLFIAVAMVALAPAALMAQEEETDYGGGTVVSVDVAARTVTVSEYDFTTDMETEVVYSVDPAAELENVDGLGGIAAGDYADIEFVTSSDGKRIAKYIAVYRAEAEEGAAEGAAVGATEEVVEGVE